MQSTILRGLLLGLTFQHYWFATLSDKCSGRRGTMNSVTDFEHLTMCTTFVDKTLLIRAFFTNVGSRQFQLITCPPKFGKTTNLNMMKRFVELNVDKQGKLQTHRTAGSATYDLFTSKDPRLKIAGLFDTRNSLFNDHLNEYPVIYITFKDIVGDTYESILQGLRDNLKMCFETYRWLYNILVQQYPNKCNDNQTLIGYQVEIMRKVLQGRIEEDGMINSLYELTRILYKYFEDRSVFLIIDDYDSPIINAIENNLNVTTVVKLIEKMFSKLFHPNHPYIQYAIIAGTFNVLDKTKFGNIKHWNFLDNHQFASFFGFTEEEVDTLLDQHGTEQTERESFKSYFKGYTVAHSNVTIYNPFSVASYLSNKNPKCTHLPLETYWAESSKIQNSLQSFRKNEISRDLLSELLASKITKFLLKKYLTIDELEKLKLIIHIRGYSLTSYDAVIFFSYLFHNGFLTHTNESYAYTIPNYEIQSYMSVLMEDGVRSPLKNGSGQLLLELEKVPPF